MSTYYFRQAHSFTCDVCDEQLVAQSYHRKCYCDVIACSKCVSTRGKRVTWCTVCDADECEVPFYKKQHRRCETMGCRRYAKSHHMMTVNRLLCDRCTLVCYNLRNPLKNQIFKR